MSNARNERLLIAPTTKKPERKGWLSREIFGWAMFDFANQSFTLVILTTMYQLYFINHVVVDDESLGRQLWAAGSIVCQILIVALSPIIGALADFSGAKKKYLFVTYAGCVIFTFSLGLVTPGSVAWGLGLFMAGYLFFAVGENFMASFLPELTPARNMGKVSAFGFTLGYTGGLLCLAGAVAVSRIGDTATGYRLVTTWAAAFFLVAALPTFLFVRERKLAGPAPRGARLLSVGFQRLAETFHSLESYRHLLIYICVMTFYLAGMQIVIFFGATIAKELFALDEVELGIYIAIITVAAIVGAFATMLFQDRIGTRRTIIIALAMWTVIMLGAMALNDERKGLFWIVGGAVGFGMGMLGTSSRAMVGLLSPPHKAAEFFGFYGLATKGAAILGLGMTILAEQVFDEGEYNKIVATSSIFFIGGLIMIFRVNEDEGRAAAIRAHEAFLAGKEKGAAPGEGQVPAVPPPPPKAGDDGASGTESR